MAAAGAVLANKLVRNCREFLTNAKHTGVQSGLLLLLILVALSRLLFAIVIWKVNGPSGFYLSDSFGYVYLAQSLLHGSFLRADAQPDIFRTPGYPLSLLPAAISGHFVFAAILENILFAVASAWLIWKITSDLLPGTKAAYWAVMLYCFEPMGWLYSARILSDTLFCAQFLLFVWLLLRFLRSPEYTRLLLAALALGCATYTRPIALYMGLWLVPILLWFPRALPWRQRMARAILFPSITILMVAPWILRNEAVAGFPTFSSAGSYSLYFYAGTSVRTKLEHRTLEQIQQAEGSTTDQHYFQLHPEQGAWTQGQIVRYLDVEGRRKIVEHPLLYTQIHLNGCAIVLFEPGVTEILKALRLYPEEGGLLTRTFDQGFMRAMLWLFQHYPIAAVAFPLMAFQLLVYYAFAAAGFTKLPTEIRCLFAAIILYFVLISGFPGSVARYRVPIMPLLCISAGIAIVSRSKKALAETEAAEVDLVAAPVRSQ